MNDAVDAHRTDLLGCDSVESLDRGGMVSHVLCQPSHLEQALARAAVAASPGPRASGLVVCAMGGSAIGAELGTAALGARARGPVQVVRGYSLPPGLGGDVAVLCVSYSGNTEETLACYEHAASLGMRRMVATTGGKLGTVARRDNVETIELPSGLQPRAAVCHLLVAFLESARHFGLAPSLRAEIFASARLLACLCDQWGPNSGPSSLAKLVATQLVGTIPVIYGAALMASVARRWKCQLNENAKIPAFYHALPADLDTALEMRCEAQAATLRPVLLDDGEFGSYTLADRISGTSRSELPGRLEPWGSTALERVLSLVLLGDLVSAYLAILLGRDPTPVNVIEQLKSMRPTDSMPTGVAPPRSAATPAS